MFQMTLSSGGQGQKGGGIDLREMRDVERVHRILNLEGFLGTPFSAASFYSKGI